MTELELQQRIKDETFISSTAWVFIILVGMVLYWAVASGVMMQIALVAQDHILSDPPGGLPGEFADQIRKGRQQGFWIAGIMGVGSLMLIVTGIAVLKRRKWGRILMTIAILVVVAVALFIVFYVGRQTMQMMNEFAVRIPG